MMKNTKLLFAPVLLAIALSLVGCKGFLDTVPKDALSPSTVWKSEGDAYKSLVGVYDGWYTGQHLLYAESMSDFGYNFHVHEGYKNIGNGEMTATNSVDHVYASSLSKIGQCNRFLEEIEGLAFKDEAVKKSMIAEVKAIRGFAYFQLNWLYGDAPIISSYKDAEEAKVPRNSAEEVKAQVYKDLEAAVVDLPNEPMETGRIAKGAALAMLMRAALYYGDYQKCTEAAKAIIALGVYDLDPSYSNLFTLAGQGSIEIILAIQADEQLYSNWTIGSMYNNGENGWSSAVPTQNLVDAYEMSTGLTKEEPGSGYDPKHPFANRDPRMYMTVLYPGADWNGGIYDTLSEKIGEVKNPNHPESANNASKTGLTWGKYLFPKSQYSNIWQTGVQPIVFRYAEVLLSLAEAENELNGPSASIYDLVDQVRNRVGMPKVDRTKYSTKQTLRELIRRERGVELAGEGTRRLDLVRWKDENGDLVAKRVLNGDLLRVVGTIDKTVTDPTMRATITGTAKVESRSFSDHNKYLPIPQGSRDRNDKLTQNTGY